MNEEVPSLAEVLKDVDGPVLPDDDHPFWDWFWGQMELSNLIHEIDKKLSGKTAWDHDWSETKENHSSARSTNSLE